MYAFQGVATGCCLVSTSTVPSLLPCGRVGAKGGLGTISMIGLSVRLCQQNLSGAKTG